MDIIILSKMSDIELTQAMKNMTEEELEALLILIVRLQSRMCEIDNYLLNK